MRGPNIFERLQMFVRNVLRDLRCKHREIFTNYTAETFTIEKFKRCGGVGFCKECGKDFMVYVPANKDEVSKLMEKMYDHTI